jgi:alpha 1,6-mannosyltransferase
MLRYLILLLNGGIYSDTDTTLLKPPSSWGRGAKLFRDGAGWVDEASLERIEAGEDVETVLGEPSVVVGIEADVGGREDWFDWWPRPVCFLSIPC